MSIMRRVLVLFLLPVAFYTVGKACHIATDGFAIVNVFSPPGDNTPWALAPLTETESETVSTALNQEFRYYQCGSQCYTFLGEDNKTILKLFKFQHMRIPPFLQHIKLPGPIGAFLDAKRKKKREVITNCFTSCHIAYTHLKEQTGLIYIHLSPTEMLKQPIVIYDKTGVRHKLDANKVEFILQKRATLAYDHISSLVKEGKREEAISALSSLLKFSINRCLNGVADKDPDFRTNFGFFKGNPIQIDIGRFSLDQTRKEPIEYLSELYRISRPLEEWLKESHPDLLYDFKDSLRDYVSEAPV